MFNKLYFLRNLLFILTFFCAGILYSQQTAVYFNADKNYRTAIELFDKEKFSAAQKKFNEVIESVPEKYSELRVNAEYYSAICALELFNADAELALKKFIEVYPESPKANLANFQLGRFYFRKKIWDNVLFWFNKVNTNELTSPENLEFKFKQGYAYFMKETYTTALKLFYEVKDTESEYAPAATYYYAHISYINGNYETAYQHLKKLEADEQFSRIVPYYMAQILFLQNKYEELITVAKPLMDTANPKRSGDIAKLIAQSYYQLNKYEDAIPYLIRYKQTATKINRDDYYVAGYCSYKTGKCADAIPQFKAVTNGNDSLAQTAYYHLGECFLKEGNKKYAQDAFRSASKMNYNATIKEDALFTYAKISYEISFHPFNDAILAFEEYINAYPNSKKLDLAYEYLVGVYFTTKNYNAALESLERIKNKGVKLNDAYQKIAYYRGIELFNDTKFNEAIEHFNKSLSVKSDKNITASTVYWKAEAYFRLNDFGKSIQNFKDFLFEPGAINFEYYNSANYALGYNYFKTKQWTEAISWFRKYTQNDKSPKSLKLNDAYNRIGDCYFITKQYNIAVEYYDKAIFSGLLDVDYALFQSAMANGVEKNNKEKSNLLLTLIKGYPNSNYLDDAYYELGESYQMMNQQEKAFEAFKKVVDVFPSSSYVPKAYNKIGLIYYNKQQDDLALNAFKKVVGDYPGSNEAKEALGKIKKIYIDNEDIAGYENYIKSVPFASESKSSLDSALYEVAEKNYFAGNCDKAVKGFSSYLEKYPNGNFSLNAHYYKADCENKAGYFNEALIGYNYVITLPKNKFTELALINAANIYFKNENLQQALNLFNKLEKIAELPDHIFKAQIASMRINFALNNFNEAISYCSIIISKDKVEESIKQEAYLLYAKSAQALNNDAKALEQFKNIENANSKFGAEAKFNIANILYAKGEYKNSEKVIFELVNKFASYEYWVAKGFILLSDNYVALNEIYQAKQTLKMVIENHKGADELVNIAKEKLKIIEDNEAGKGARKSNENEGEGNGFEIKYNETK